MPTTYYWTGAAGDGLPASATNWNTARDGSGSSAIPGSGGDNNDSYFIESAALDIAGYDFGTNRLINVGINFDRNAGTSATALTMAVSGTFTVRTRGQGTIVAAAKGTGNNVIALVDCKSTGNGGLYLTGGTVNAVRMGTLAEVHVSASCTIVATTGYIRVAAGRLYIEAAASGGIPILIVGTGWVECQRPVTTSYVGAGGEIRTKGPAVTVGTSWVFGGGKHVHLSPGTITTQEVASGGTATALGSPYSSLTVTNLYKHDGAFAYDDCPWVTVSNSFPVGDTMI